MLVQMILRGASFVRCNSVSARVYCEGGDSSEGGKEYSKSGSRMTRISKKLCQRKDVEWVILDASVKVTSLDACR